MSAIIKNTMRVFTANQFLNLFGNKLDSTWTPSTAYLLGDVVRSGNNRYIATVAGTSGLVAPSHVSGESTDNTVTWLFVETDIETDYYTNSVYAAIGKSDAWTNEPTPDAPTNDDVDDITILSENIFLKKITQGNVKMAIEHHAWTTNTLYDAYDDTVEDFNYANPFYVINDEADKNIYKCLSNNGGVLSVDKPIGQSITPVKTADGYVWQYMASVSSADAFFMTNNYIPVERKLVAGSKQWDVQEAATGGSVSNIEVTRSGGGYLADPTITVVPAAGETPTTPMTVTPTISAQGIAEITITDPGEGYLQPPLIVVTPDAGDTDPHAPTMVVATLGASDSIASISITGAGQYHTPINNTHVVITSPGGGANAVLEPVLDENNVITSFTITDAGTGYAIGDEITIVDGTTDAHDYITVVTNQPQNGHGYNILEELNAKNVILNVRLEDTEGGFLSDTATFRRICILVDPEVSDGSGVATATRYKGPDSIYYVGSSSEDIQPGTGQLLYVENVEVIQRGTNQIEDMKIILKF